MSLNACPIIVDHQRRNLKQNTTLHRKELSHICGEMCTAYINTVKT